MSSVAHVRKGYEKQRFGSVEVVTAAFPKTPKWFYFSIESFSKLRYHLFLFC